MVSCLLILVGALIPEDLEQVQDKETNKSVGKFVLTIQSSKVPKGPIHKQALARGGRRFGEVIAKEERNERPDRADRDKKKGDRRK